MIDPLFWLGLSILLVAASLTAVLVAAIPALQELARASRSAEKFFDTLSRELPPTLNAIRNTSLEITDLTDDVSEGVKSAGQVVKQVDQSLDNARKQAQNIQVSTRSILVGVKAAWKSFTRPKPNRRILERLPMNDQPQLTLREREIPIPENRRTESKTYRNNNGYSEAVNWDNDFDDE
ncbi:DUF948 domain-containing protein [Sphaerospermopsis aphanizomenoides BCCUSP55]|uniref:DUF948 domain-containing protein n=1 Tax=Sphaerospermopsis aphanizomenoides TaxID=459663 RepID=UPI001904C5E9|nr:DUF948 domain-containing protein [Sphaerospermopsis aphanizomenoides]MBK1990557.1 DUF948 domain-containing protein [Sphaerospermopsis aphanizomenoides BCCUSP55]